MAETLPQRSKALNLPAFGAQPDLSDMKTALAEADYQLELLLLLERKAQRHARLGYFAASVSIFIGIGAGFIALSSRFVSWPERIIPVSAVELIQTLTFIIGLLAVIIVERSNKSRDRKNLLSIEVRRLKSAIDAAYVEAGRRTGDPSNPL